MPANKRRQFFIKMIITHSVTYMLIGLSASNLFNYAELFTNPAFRGFMRTLEDPIVMLGPALQPIRGFIFALVLLPFSKVFLDNKSGWLYLWGLFLGLGIFSTFGPSPGSIEGMIYSTFPITSNLGGWIEVILQSWLLAIIFIYWFNHPQKIWFNWLMGIAFFFTITFPLLGLLATSHI
jgi:hypothetical protein